MKNSKIKELVGIKNIKEHLLDSIEDFLGETVDNSIDSVLDDLRIDNQVDQELNEEDEDYLIDLRNEIVEKIISAISNI